MEISYFLYQCKREGYSYLFYLEYKYTQLYRFYDVLFMEYERLSLTSLKLFEEISKWLSIFFGIIPQHQALSILKHFVTKLVPFIH